jgi:hypothetical protein
MLRDVRVSTKEASKWQQFRRSKHSFDLRRSRWFHQLSEMFSRPLLELSIVDVKYGSESRSHLSRRADDQLRAICRARFDHEPQRMDRGVAHPKVFVIQ